jgi:hypothetical protein
MRSPFGESESERLKEEDFSCFHGDGGSRGANHNNYPLLKRPHQAGRWSSCSTNGASHGANGNGHHHQYQNPSASPNPKIRLTPAKTNFYRIVTAVVTIFFLVQTLGVFFLLLPRGDLGSLSSEGNPHLKYSWREEEVVPTEDVRFVPRTVVERLLLSKSRATVANLRDEIRSPIRPPRLALVRTKLYSSFTNYDIFFHRLFWFCIQYQ